MDEGLKKTMKELEARFERVFERPGRKGQTWAYLANADVVNRLNKVFGLRWNAVEKYSEVVPGGKEGDVYVIKRVQLEVEDPTTGKGWVKEAWGSHKFMTEDPADAHKSAFSKAITKAASLLGVGLYLYGLEEEEPDVAEAILNGNGNTQQYIPEEETAVEESPMPAMVSPTPIPVPNLKNPTIMEPAQTTKTAGSPAGRGIPTDIPLIRPVPTMGKVTGRSPVQGQPATAQVVLQQVAVSEEQPVQSQQEIDGYPTQYQISTIKAVAAMQHKDALAIVNEVLGAEAEGITSLEELTSLQASRVLAEKRKIQVEGKYK